MSRSRASRSSSRPAGMPSTIATSPGPCDSPAVVKRNTPQGYMPGVTLFEQNVAALFVGDADGRFEFDHQVHPGPAGFVEPHLGDDPGPDRQRHDRAGARRRAGDEFDAEPAERHGARTRDFDLDLAPRPVHEDLENPE